MTPIRPLLAALAAVVAIALGPGCGGGGGGDDAGTVTTATTAGPAPLPTSTRARADSNCRELVHGAEALARGPARLGTLKYSSNLDQLLRGFIRPGIPLYARLASQQRALEPEANNPSFSRYVDFFDPIVVLAQQMIRAGSMNVREGIRLNRLLTQVTLEQRQEARALGLRDCAVDLQKIVTSAYR
jgi:hypothetical protein